MTDADEEGESEDEALFLDTNARRPAKKRTSEEGDLKKDKDERAAKLRKMMDSDDESEQIPATTNVKKEDADDKEAEDADVAWSESGSEKPKALGQDKTYVKEELEAVNTEPTRRRGRRKVMKKRTMKDEEGYLVTKEEAVWESEPASQPKPKSQPRSSSGTGKASGKAAGKGGNIKSFFGKK
jgi:DNA polymerase delta subunit 3